MILFLLLAVSASPVSHAQAKAAAAPSVAAPDAGEQPSDEDEDEEGRQSGAIVVTARRLDAARTGIDAALGATVYNLHNETIENRPGGETGSVGSILAQTPGVTLSGTGLSIRGSRAVQVRINDVIIPEAIADPEDRLSSRLAESTRLITGTLPAQFGFAPAGVIAVTTKNGLYQHGGQIELFGGSHGALEPAFEWGGSAESSSLFSSGSLETGRTRVADVIGPSASDVRHEIGGLAFADHVIDSENRVSLVLGGSRERRRIGETDLPAGIERTGAAYGVATYQHSAEEFTIQASVFAGRGTQSADFGQQRGEVTGSTGAQLDSSVQLGSGNRLRSGMLLARRSARETGVGSIAAAEERTSLGLYAQDEWKPVGGLTVNAGVRLDWLRGLGARAAVQPRASLVWSSSSRLALHLGYARYASTPSLGETPENVRLPDERDDYVDAGVQEKIGPLTVGLDGYYRRARDLVAEHKRPGDAVPTAFSFEDGRFRGVELSATYARGPITAWANLSVSKAQGRTIIGGGTLFGSATLAAAAGRWVNLSSDRPVSASGGITWRIGRLDLSGDVLAGSGAVRTFQADDPNGARESPYATVGVAAVYHTRLFDQPLDLRADLTNITDAHYVTSDAANLEGDWTRFAEGRAILVGFEQGF